MKPTMRLSVDQLLPVDRIVFVGVDDQRAVGALPGLGEIGRLQPATGGANAAKAAAKRRRPRTGALNCTGDNSAEVRMLSNPARTVG